MMITMKILRKSQFFLSGIRTLYSSEALGMGSFLKTREIVKNQFYDIKDIFKNKMNDFVTSDTHMVFTEDLKNMVHLAEESDLDLLKRMMLKFMKQNKELRFGSFIFGPVVMRLYYHLEKPAEALEVFKNQEMSGFFDQLITFQILLDLLLKQGMYHEMFDVFEIIKNKQLQGSKYPKNVVVLILAACYKIKTPESYEFSKKLWSDLTDTGHYPMRRAGTFAAALALEQNEPGVALEILTSMRQQNYVTVRNLKIAAFADLGRPDDALSIFKTFLEMDIPNGSNKTVTFYEEVMEKMRVAINKLGRKEVIQSFERIENQLKAMGALTSAPMEDLLFSEIVAVTNTDDRRSQRIIPEKYKIRPGLQDLI